MTARLKTPNARLTAPDTAHWRERARASELAVATLKETLDLTQSFKEDAQNRADILAQHLRLVLEVARTWRPDYATKMDTDTLQMAVGALVEGGSEHATDAIAQAFNAGQAKQARVTELAFAALNRNADLGEAAEPDAARFRWLTEDHADQQTRAKCRELLGRMSVMSYSAACADIDSAMAEDMKRATAPGGGLGA